MITIDKLKVIARSIDFVEAVDRKLIDEFSIPEEIKQHWKKYLNEKEKLKKVLLKYDIVWE